MTSWRKHYYLSDLCPGDYVRCDVGVLWMENGNFSAMCSAIGLTGIVLDTDGENLFILRSNGQIEHYIDHYNEPTRWCYVEDA